MPTSSQAIRKPIILLLCHEYFRAVEFIAHNWPERQWGKITSVKRAEGIYETDKIRFIIVNKHEVMMSMVALNYYCLPGLENHPQLSLMIQIANQRRYQGWVHAETVRLREKQERRNTRVRNGDRKSAPVTTGTAKPSKTLQSPDK